MGLVLASGWTEVEDAVLVFTPAERLKIWWREGGVKLEFGEGGRRRVRNGGGLGEIVTSV